MPDLDVSDILLDPDFCGPITVIRNQQVIGADGVVTLVPTTFTPIGVITIGSPKGLTRTEEYEANHNTITVHTYAFRLRGPTPGFEPDTIMFEGDPYLATKSANWSSYGTGFTMAEAELKTTVTQS